MGRGANANCGAAAAPRTMPRQDALTDQLSDLVTVANRQGLYDASDWLKTQLGEDYAPGLRIGQEVCFLGVVGGMITGEIISGPRYGNYEVLVSELGEEPITVPVSEFRLSLGEQKPQRQDALNDQIADLAKRAIEQRCYDAAAWLNGSLLDGQLADGRRY
jgi:hypothetical protein